MRKSMRLLVIGLLCWLTVSVNAQEFGDPFILVPLSETYPEDFDAHLSPNGEYIVAMQVEDRDNDKFHLIVWKTEDFKGHVPPPVRQIEVPKAAINSYIWMAIAPDSQRVAVQTQGYVKLFRLPDLSLIKTYETDKKIDLPRMAWSLDGQYLGVLFENEVVIWDTLEDIIYEHPNDAPYNTISPLGSENWYAEMDEEGIFEICDIHLTLCETYDAGTRYIFLSPHQNMLISRAYEENVQTSYLWQSVDDAYEVSEIAALDDKSVLSVWGQLIVYAVPKSGKTGIFDLETMEIVNSDLLPIRQWIGTYIDDDLIFICSYRKLALYTLGNNAPTDTFDLSHEPQWKGIDVAPYSIPEAFQVMGSPNWSLIGFGNFHMLIPLERD